MSAWGWQKLLGLERDSEKLNHPRHHLRISW